jgi:N-acetylglutamate synthase-like GNAT family acetyltransferase
MSTMSTPRSGPLPAASPPSAPAAPAAPVTPAAQSPAGQTRAGRSARPLRVGAERSPLFCDTALAARIEQAEAQLIAGWSAATRRRRGDSTGFVTPVAGGVASFAEQDSPLNKVAGLGFDGAPSVADLDELERAFAAHGAAVQVDLAAADDVRRYIALHDGVVAGGASLRMTEGIAQLTGAATAPAHRRRGIQTALLAARLADAAAADCEIAVVTTQPGSRSQQNAQRQGFDLLYTRAILVKQPSSSP